MAIALIVIIGILLAFIAVLVHVLRKTKLASIRIDWKIARDEAMGEFNFRRAADVMQYLDWKWASVDMSVPDEDDIREHVESAIDQAIAGLDEEHTDWYHVESGGYEVIASYSDESGKRKPSICIRFIVESSGDCYV